MKKIIKLFIPPFLYKIWCRFRNFNYKQWQYQKFLEKRNFPTVIMVNPKDIVYRTEKELDCRYYQNNVLGGNWDKLTNYFDESEWFYKSFVDFLNGTKWEDTDIYKWLLSQIKKGKTMHGATNEKELLTYLNKLAEVYSDIKTNGFKMSDNILDQVGVNIGRHGDLLFNNGRHRLVFAKILNIDKIPVVVSVRHEKWNAFKNEIIDYSIKHSKGKLYARIEHPDLVDIPYSHDNNRLEIINSHIDLDKGTVLDIGCNLGQIGFFFDKLGFDVTSVESLAINTPFLNKLKRASRHNNTIVGESIFTFYKKNPNHYDIVLAFNIFHHFIKDEKVFNEFKSFLNTLKCKQMFFQSHYFDEIQMKNAFINFHPEEFVQFIIDNSCLTDYKYIGTNELDQRPIYKLFVKE